MMTPERKLRSLVIKKAAGKMRGGFDPVYAIGELAQILEFEIERQQEALRKSPRLPAKERAASLLDIKRLQEQVEILRRNPGLASIGITPSPEAFEDLRSYLDDPPAADGLAKLAAQLREAGYPTVVLMTPGPPYAPTLEWSKLLRLPAWIYQPPRGGSSPDAAPLRPDWRENRPDRAAEPSGVAAGDVSPGAERPEADVRAIEELLVTLKKMHAAAEPEIRSVIEEDRANGLLDTIRKLTRQLEEARRTE